jgi:hypothetical protein
MRHYKSFLIMQRFVAEAWRQLSERFLEVFRYPVERVLNITPTPRRSSGCAERVGWKAEDLDDTFHRDALVSDIQGDGGRDAAENLPPLNSIVLERE